MGDITDVFGTSTVAGRVAAERFCAATSSTGQANRIKNFFTYVVDTPVIGVSVA